MAETVSLSARVKKETMEQVNELIEKFQEDSIAKVSQRAVIEKAIDDLYKKTLKGE